MTTTAEKKTYRCCLTGTEREGNPQRLPRGWRRIGEDYYSPDAWHARYVARAVTLPIVAPVVPPGSGPQSEAWRAAWKELDTMLSEAWSRSTNAACWALKELLKNDVTRSPEMTKCPKMPPIYLYGLGEWAGWSQSASSVLRNVEAAYRARRYETIWLGKSRLPDVRYPYPYPLTSQGYDLSIDDGGRPVLTGRLPAGRVSVWLKGGPRYRRQRKQLEHLIEHPELRGEAAIYRRGQQTVAKVVGWFPRHEKTRAGTMYVRTDSESFLVALNERDERLFVIHGDWIRERLIRHERGMQRWRDDQKAELRRPKRRRQKSLEDMQKRTRKTRDRVNTFIDQAAAQIVGHADRRKLARVVYRDTHRDYFRDFPWHRLATAIEQRCQLAGIICERPSGGETAGTARNGNGAAQTEEEKHVGT